MNNEKAIFVMVPIPLEVLEESGINAGDLVQFTAGNGALIMESMVDFHDIVCDGNCDNCPVDQTECNNACGSCPCCDGCDESEGE